jgi:hypothetical protein
VAASSPEQAKNQAETKDRARATKLKSQEEANKKHLQDLITRFGEVGTESGNTRVGLDQYGNLVLQEFKYNKKDEPVDTREVFFWVADDGISFQILNGSAAIKKLREGFKGNLESLRKQLYDKQFMSEEEYLSKDENALNKALLSSARNYSTIQVQSYTIDGKTKFTPYKSWLSGIVATRKGDESGYPRRDIDLQDRDVIRALVEDVYMDTNMQLPDDPSVIEAKVDRYMDMIKKGVLTTAKEVKGENVFTTGKGFSEARVRAELGKEIPTENPEAYQKAQSLNFLSFLAQMEQR